MSLQCICIGVYHWRGTSLVDPHPHRCMLMQWKIQRWICMLFTSTTNRRKVQVTEVCARRPSPIKTISILRRKTEMTHNSNCLTNHLILDRMLGACGCGETPLEFKQYAAPTPGSASKFNHLFILKSSTSAVTWMWWFDLSSQKTSLILVTLLGVHQSASMYIWYMLLFCVCLLHDKPFQPKSIASPHRQDPFNQSKGLIGKHPMQGCSPQICAQDLLPVFTGKVLVEPISSVFSKDAGVSRSCASS